MSKASQAIAAEVADYSKKSFEDGTEVIEKLFGAKSLDKAIEIQTDYAKTAYEGFVAQATKIGELYADLAKETYKPFEGYIAKAAPRSNSARFTASLRKSPADWPGFLHFAVPQDPLISTMRSCERLVPIWLKVVHDPVGRGQQEELALSRIFARAAGAVLQQGRGRIAAGVDLHGVERDAGSLDVGAGHRLARVDRGLVRVPAVCVLRPSVSRMMTCW